MEEIKLIQLVKYHELLYDPDNRDYTNKKKKEKVWDDIGRQLKRSGKYTLRKIFNLCSTYFSTNSDYVIDMNKIEKKILKPYIFLIILKIIVNRGIKCNI